MMFEESKGQIAAFDGSLYGRGSGNGGGSTNFSCISWCHCLRRFAGVMIKIRRFRSAHFCESAIPPRWFFPGQLRLLIGRLWRAELVANSAASTWCGFRSTCASSSAPASFSTLSEAQRLVS